MRAPKWTPVDDAPSRIEFANNIVSTQGFPERGRDDDCSESYNMRLGTYGTQGEFGWQRTTPAAAPQWVLPSRRCSSSNWRRGVGVEWEDHEGNFGYEWVAY